MRLILRFSWLAAVDRISLRVSLALRVHLQLLFGALIRAACKVRANYTKRFCRQILRTRFEDERSAITDNDFYFPGNCLPDIGAPLNAMLGASSLRAVTLSFTVSGVRHLELLFIIIPELKRAFGKRVSRSPCRSRTHSRLSLSGSIACSGEHIRRDCRDSRESREYHFPLFSHVVSHYET